MEPLWKLVYLLEPAPVTLILMAIAVTFGSAFRALNSGKEMEKNRELSEAYVTLDSYEALIIPIMGSCCLLLMFYKFSSVSLLFTGFVTVASVFTLYFCLSPYIVHVKSRFGLADPFVSHCCSKSFTKIQGLLLLLCSSTVAAWFVSGHWILNNLLCISLCNEIVGHIRLPNIKTCAMLLISLFVYDIFWVFYSDRFFGANVMVSVATQLASDPVHTVANSSSLPGLQLITKRLELPVKIVFPWNLFGGKVPGYSATDFMMLGLADMSFPSMLLAVVLRFDQRKDKNIVSLLDLSPYKGHKYIWYALSGYAIGLVTAFAASILTLSPQPALLYLVPSTLGSIVVISWMRKELKELWEGTTTLYSAQRTHVAEV